MEVSMSGIECKKRFKRLLIALFVFPILLIVGPVHVSASPLLDLICKNYETHRVNEQYQKFEFQKTATAHYMKRVKLFEDYVVLYYPADDNDPNIFKYINKRNTGTTRNINPPDFFISAYREGDPDSQVMYLYKINSSNWSIGLVNGSSNRKNFYISIDWHQCTSIVNNIN